MCIREYTLIKFDTEAILIVGKVFILDNGIF